MHYVFLSQAYLSIAAAITPTAALAQSPSSQIQQSSASGNVTAFVHVGVVPMDTERTLADQTVLVEGGRITALGPANEIKIPAGAARIDGQGKFLIPGLVDMHTHMRRTLIAAKTDAELDRLMLRYVATGVTTVRNMDHIISPEAGQRALQLRARAAAGTIISPKIYTSGRWRTYLTGDVDPRTYRPANDKLEDIAPQVAAYKAAGYDFIKVYSWDTGQVFDSLMAAARREGLIVAGHVPWGVTVEQAIAAGMKSIEHQTEYYPRASRATPEVIPTLTDERFAALVTATQQAGVWNCPTLARANPKYKPIRGRFIKALQEAGAGLLLGTDQETVDASYRGIVYAQLQSLVEHAGLTPYEALATGTRSPAQYFGTLNDVGTVTAGKRADLLLLDGNPLESLKHVAQPSGVMVGGRWLSRQELERRLGE